MIGIPELIIIGVVGFPVIVALAGTGRRESPAAKGRRMPPSAEEKRLDRPGRHAQGVRDVTDCQFLTVIKNDGGAFA
jgi:hypothetical protein